MRTICLPYWQIHTGPLILVNRTYAYRECVPGQAAAGGLVMEPVTGAAGMPADWKMYHKAQTAGGLAGVMESGISGPQALGENGGKNQSSPVCLAGCAAYALSALMEELDGWRQIAAVSGWRSMREQQCIWEDSLAENGQVFTETYVALPGHSEHQTGLAIDLGRKQEVIDFIRPEFPYDGICGTFRQRAADYGFIERYPEGKEDITGIGHEPWHFRYVGVPHAGVMASLGLTLEEYISFLCRFPYGTQAYTVRDGGRDYHISYQEVPPRGETWLEVEEGTACMISGNNVNGCIITQTGV